MTVIGDYAFYGCALLAEIWKPLITSIGSRYAGNAGTFAFAVDWAFGRNSVVEVSEDSALTMWTPIATNMLEELSSTFMDPVSVETRARFYRLRAP